MLQLLDDLCGRLRRQGDLAEAVWRTTQSDNQTRVCEWPLWQLLRTAAAEHSRGMGDVQQFAALIAERIAPGRSAAKKGGTP
jgi:hypothetical protein